MAKPFLLLVCGFFYLILPSYSQAPDNAQTPSSTAPKDSKKAQSQSAGESPKNLNELLVSKDTELVDLNSIKTVLKNDQLKEVVEEKIKNINLIKEQDETLTIKKYMYPEEKDIWGVTTELWLVKMAPQLQWDFNKPDYGIMRSVINLFEMLGLYEQRFKLLLVNTPIVPHFILPLHNKSFVAIISLPFIRNLDLTKREISLLVLEGFIRLNLNYFKKAILENKLTDKLGKNFYKKTYDEKLIKSFMEKYTDFIFKKGFNFQQQYEVTKRMDMILKGHPEYRVSYITMLKKVEKLIKLNPNFLHTNYNSLYPTPELQVNWLN